MLVTILSVLEHVYGSTANNMFSITLLSTTFVYKQFVLLIVTLFPHSFIPFSCVGSSESNDSKRVQPAETYQQHYVLLHQT